MPRPARPMNPTRRSALVDAAADAFVRHGFGAASLNAIVAEAGIAKSSLYHHVGDKEDLFDLVLADRLAALVDRIPLPDPATLSATSFWPTIDDALAALERAAIEDPRSLEAGRLVHLSDCPDVPSLRAFGEILHAWFVAALDRGRELRVVDASTPPELQRSLVVAIAVELDRWALSAPDHPGGHAIAGSILRRLLLPRGS